MQPNQKEIQNKMSDIQQKLLTITVEGNAGTGDLAVKVELNCNYEATKVTITEELFKQPPEVMCDLIKSAITDATRNATTTIQKEMMAAFQGFKM